MTDTSDYELNAELRPDETVCLSRRAGAQRGSGFSEELIFTDRRLLLKSNDLSPTRIDLDEIMVAQLLGPRRLSRLGASPAYYRLTLSDGAVHRVFVLDDYRTFANCLPSSAKIYNSEKDLKGGGVFRTARKLGLIAGMGVGLGAGALVLTGLNVALGGAIDSAVWSIVLVCIFLFGGLIAGGYVGTLLGITVAYWRLKKSLSLAEAKELAIVGMALDVGGPSFAARFNLKAVRGHLECTLSRAYRQPVQLD